MRKLQMISSLKSRSAPPAKFFWTSRASELLQRQLIEAQKDSESRINHWQTEFKKDLLKSQTELKEELRRSQTESKKEQTEFKKDLLKSQTDLKTDLHKLQEANNFKLVGLLCGAIVLIVTFFDGIGGHIFFPWKKVKTTSE